MSISEQVTDIPTREYEYNASKAEEIARADKAREQRTAAHLARVSKMGFSDADRIPEVDGIPVETLMQPDVTTVRTPVGVEQVRLDYDGSLGGSSPRNPLKIGGIVH